MNKKRIAFIALIAVAVILILVPSGCAGLPSTWSEPATPSGPTIRQPSPTRDLTGTWAGSGVYYQLNLSGKLQQSHRDIC